MSNPTSNFGWVMPDPTDLVTNLPADFEVFGQAVDTSMADLKGGTTGQILSKTSATDMDFTWIANDQGDITAVNVTAPITGGGTSGAVTIGVSAATTSAAGVVQLSDSTSTTSSVLASTPTATKSAYDLANTANTTANAAIPKSTVTTAGDVIYATGSSAVTRLGVGSTGQVLTVAAGVPSWATPASSGAFTKINTTSFSAVASQAVNSVFTSTYKNYRVLITLSACTADGIVYLRLRASGTDAATNYYYGVVGIDAAAVAANQTGIAQAQFLLSDLDSNSSGSRYSYALDVYNPQAAVDTSFGKVYNAITQASAVYGGAGGGLHVGGATQYDGFSIIASAGNITGKVTIYGYSD